MTDETYNQVQAARLAREWENRGFRAGYKRGLSELPKLEQYKRERDEARALLRQVHDELVLFSEVYDIGAKGNSLSAPDIPADIMARWHLGRDVAAYMKGKNDANSSVG